MVTWSRTDNGKVYPKGSLTLTSAICGSCSRLRQCRDGNFSISLQQCNHLLLLHAAASNATSAKGALTLPR